MFTGLSEIFQNVPEGLNTLKARAQIYGGNGKVHGERDVTLCRNGDGYWSKEINGERFLCMGHIVSEDYDGGLGA